MAIWSPNWTPCSICGRTLFDDEAIVATSHFISDPADPLAPYSDTAMHRTCLDAWEHRDAFIAKRRRGDETDHHYWEWPDNATFFPRDHNPVAHKARRSPMELLREEFHVAPIDDPPRFDSRTFILAVTSARSPDDMCATWLPRVTVAPIHCLRDLMRRGERGIPLVPVADIPPQIERRDGVHYFQLASPPHHLWIALGEAKPRERALVIHMGPESADTDPTLWTWFRRPASVAAHASRT